MQWMPNTCSTNCDEADCVAHPSKALKPLVTSSLFPLYYRPFIPLYAKRKHGTFDGEAATTSCKLCLAITSTACACRFDISFWRVIDECSSDLIHWTNLHWIIWLSKCPYNSLLQTSLNGAVSHFHSAFGQTPLAYHSPFCYGPFLLLRSVLLLF